MKNKCCMRCKCNTILYKPSSRVQVCKECIFETIKQQNHSITKKEFEKHLKKMYEKIN